MTIASVWRAIDEMRGSDGMDQALVTEIAFRGESSERPVDLITTIQETAGGMFHFDLSKDAVSVAKNFSELTAANEPRLRHWKATSLKAF